MGVSDNLPNDMDTNIRANFADDYPRKNDQYHKRYKQKILMVIQNKLWKESLTCELSQNSNLDWVIQVESSLSVLFEE